MLKRKTDTGYAEDKMITDHPAVISKLTDMCFNIEANTGQQHSVSYKEY